MKKLSGKMAPVRAGFRWQSGGKQAKKPPIIGCRQSPKLAIYGATSMEWRSKPVSNLRSRSRVSAAPGLSHRIIIVTLASTRRLRRFMTAPNNRKAPIGPAISDPFTWLVAGVR